MLLRLHNLRSLVWPGFPLLAGLCAPACDNYPLEPSLCDDWCRSSLTQGCDGDPVDCVTQCEESRAKPQCQPLQRNLLTCYDQTEGALYCAVEYGETRVSNAACEKQREEWVACESPGIGACHASCREQQIEIFGESVQSSFLAKPMSPILEFPNVDLPTVDPSIAQAGGISDAGSPSPTRGSSLPSYLCPSLDLPCEEICWALAAFLGSSNRPVVQAAFADCYPSGPSERASSGK